MSQMTERDLSPSHSADTKYNLKMMQRSKTNVALKEEFEDIDLMKQIRHE